MRLIDADALLAKMYANQPYNWAEYFKKMVDAAPTIDPLALEDEANRCVVGGYHEWTLSCIGSDEVGNRINTYHCRKCGEEFKVKFEWA